jgi:hypothetical protein
MDHLESPHVRRKVSTLIKSKVPLVTRLPPNLFSDGNSLYFLSVDSLALLGLLVRVSEL